MSQTRKKRKKNFGEVIIIASVNKYQWPVEEKTVLVLKEEEYKKMIVAFVPRCPGPGFCMWWKVSA